MKLNIKRSLIIFSLILPFYNSVFAAEIARDEEQDIHLSNESSEAQEVSRWFQVELIVFKPNNEKSMTDESWDKKLTFTPTEKLIDFLQPYYLEKDLNASENKTLESTDTEQENFEKNTTLTQPVVQTNASIIDINSIDEEAKLLTKFNQPAEEKPFVLLSDDVMQLTKEAANLNRHRDYQVLTHLAWRQPMVGKNETTNIRIAGGQDLSDQFTYDGRHLGSLLSIGNETNNDLVEEEISQHASGYASNFQQLHNSDITDNVNNLDAGSIDNQTNFIPQIIPMLWVPELDGDIKIYLNRYLHIQTNLFLRKPGKEIIEAVDLDLYNPELLNSFSTENNEAGFTPINASVSTENILSTIDNVKNKTSTQMNKDAHLNKKTRQFSWEISDSFLEEGSEQIFVERLFNYSINQSRRVRSGELHYFDHPLIGLVILITPYELPSEPVGNLNDKKKSN